MGEMIETESLDRFKRKKSLKKLEEVTPPTKKDSIKTKLDNTPDNLI